MRFSRATFLTAMAACSLAGGLAACGGDQADIEAKVNAASAGPANISDGLAQGNTPQDQANADADAVAAEQARKRRKELADLEKAQQAETAKLLKEGSPGGNDGDESVPIGSADPELETFRSRLSGVCSGGQKRITKVSQEAADIAKSKDATKILAVAQDYSRALDDFINALRGLEAPASVKSDYAAWLTTIEDLSTNVRLQLVSQGDPKKAQKLQEQTTKLTNQLIVQSAGLGVTCLSITG